MAKSLCGRGIVDHLAAPRPTWVGDVLAMPFGMREIACRHSHKCPCRQYKAWKRMRRDVTSPDLIMALPTFAGLRLTLPHTFGSPVVLDQGLMPRHPPIDSRAYPEGCL